MDSKEKELEQREKALEELEKKLEKRERELVFFSEREKYIGPSPAEWPYSSYSFPP